MSDPAVAPNQADFTDDLSDEALDRVDDFAGTAGTINCKGGTLGTVGSLTLPPREG